MERLYFYNIAVHCWPRLLLGNVYSNLSALEGSWNGIKFFGPYLFAQCNLHDFTIFLQKYSRCLSGCLKTLHTILANCGNVWGHILASHFNSSPWPSNTDLLKIKHPSTSKSFFVVNTNEKVVLWNSTCGLHFSLCAFAML